MDDLLIWDDLRRELTAILAGAVYLAAVRLIRHYKGLLDRWLKPEDEPTKPARAPEKPDTPPDR
jgi:hypothetical protein